MRIYDIIKKKRDGGELTADEINFFISDFTGGKIPDYQASALLMAIFLKGMTDAEIANLTFAMAKSGDTTDLSGLGNLSVDKHSTGGVGDKTSLIVAPIVAVCGGKVAKMSGRGLGFTGGTVDKLESIPGYKTELDNSAFLSQAEKIGIAVVGQSGRLAPADKLIYALRDVTATVESIPLITSSIMSKKIAAGSHNIVLDVKAGKGAFMKTSADAEILARKMVEIGKRCGRNISAVITDMNCPLGYAVGNGLEVAEAVQVLKGEVGGDIAEVSFALAEEMLALCKMKSVQEAKKEVERAVSSGAAFEKMIEWISAQGSDADFVYHPERLYSAAYKKEVLSEKSGYITSLDAETVGISALISGAGRTVKEDLVDYAAGIKIYKKTGDRVEKGERLCTVYSSDKEKLNPAAAKYLSAVTVGNEKPPERNIILKKLK